MSLGFDKDDTRVCAVCKKQFDVLFPDLWRYRKMSSKGWRYYCSWGHMRKEERDKQMEKQARKKAPGRPKKTVTEKTFENKNGTVTVKQIREAVKDAAEEKQPEEEESVALVYDPSIREEYQREQNAKMKITEPLRYDGMEVRSVYLPGLGEFHYDKEYNSLDWKTLAGDEVDLPPVFWKDLIREFPRIGRVLGIDLEAEE